MPSISNPPPHPIDKWHFSIQGLQNNDIYIAAREIADQALRRERMFWDHMDLFSESDEFLFGLTQLFFIDPCNHLEPAFGATI